MQFKSREILLHDSQSPQVLYNHAVQSLIVVRRHVFCQFFQLGFLKQCIDRHIQPASMQMHIVNGFQKPLFIRIIRIGPGPEPGAAHVYGICPGCHRSLHAGPGTCRCQYLCLFFFHFVPTFPERKDASRIIMRHPPCICYSIAQMNLLSLLAAQDGPICARLCVNLPF